MPPRTRQNSHWRSVEAEATKIPGVSAFPSQFNPVPALWLDGREFASFHDPEIALGVSRKLIKELEARGKMPTNSPSGSRDWIWVELQTKADIPKAIGLIRADIEEKRKKGEAPRPMPDDKALARRRRLHRQPTHDLDV